MAETWEVQLYDPDETAAKHYVTLTDFDKVKALVGDGKARGDVVYVIAPLGETAEQTADLMRLGAVRNRP